MLQAAGAAQDCQKGSGTLDVEGGSLKVKGEAPGGRYQRIGVLLGRRDLQAPHRYLRDEAYLLGLHPAYSPIIPLRDMLQSTHINRLSRHQRLQQGVQDGGINNTS